MWREYPRVGRPKDIFEVQVQILSRVKDMLRDSYFYQSLVKDVIDILLQKYKIFFTSQNNLPCFCVSIEFFSFKFLARAFLGQMVKWSNIF